MTAVIIDDEQNCHDNLVSLLSEFHPEVDVLGAAYNVKSGIELIKHKKPEILFLDIKLPDGTGFELLEGIDHHQFAIIFITGHNKYARLAIDFAALAYLGKPVAVGKLAEALNRSRERLLYRNFQQQYLDLQEVIENFRTQNLPSRLAVSNSSGVHYVPVCEITYLTVNQGCTEIHQIDGKRVFVSANLIEYNRRFAPYVGFMQIHRSFIVNLEHVSIYRNLGEVVLTNGQIIPVSQRHQEELKLRLQLI